MTTAGWIFMLTSWVVLSCLLCYCYWRIFHTRKPKEEWHKQSL